MLETLFTILILSSPAIALFFGYHWVSREFFESLDRERGDR